MRSLQWAQATADIADRMVQRAVSKIVDNAHPAACEEAKTDIGKQVERVRAVLQPGVTISERVVAAERFVVNSTQPWWEKVFRPDARDLIDHPWFRYLKHHGEDPARVVKTETAGNSGDSDEDGMAVEVDGQGEDMEIDQAQPVPPASTMTTPDGPCRACVDRGTPCDPQPGVRCVQCKTRRTKCSHSVQTKPKRGRRGSSPAPAAKRARMIKTEVDDPPLDLTEDDAQAESADAPPESQPRSPTPPASVPPPIRPTDAAFVSREEHNNLVDAYNKLEQRVRNIENELLSRTRAAKSTAR